MKDYKATVIVIHKANLPAKNKKAAIKYLKDFFSMGITKPEVKIEIENDK